MRRATGKTGWTNWAGTATAEPHTLVRPQDLDGIADAVRQAAKTDTTVRALGSGHSFSPVGVASGAAVDLSQWTGVVESDQRTGLVTVRSGTTLCRLNAELDRLGLAMTNLGDIDAQTIAGAISTGTHGTGAELGGMATQVAALELVLADGSVTRCSADEQPELFAAARVSLGALGIISTVTLRCEPTFLLQAQEEPMPLDQVLAGFHQFAAENDHFEFFWFPYGRTALVKRNNRLPAGLLPEPLSPIRQYLEYQLVENTAFGLLCRLGRAVPALVPPLHRLSSSVLSSRSYRDLSHRVFTTSRQVRFVETEWAVPRDALVDVLRELRAVVGRLDHPVMFPVEVRVAAPDDIWLSTAFGRDSAYLAAHQFVGMPYEAWFAAVAEVCGEVGGRPHWGKMHGLDASALRDRYPRFDDFRRVRDAVDPEGRFRNAYLDEVLGLPGDADR